ARISAAIEGWLERKEDALAATREADFWDSPDRFAIFGLVEYLDRLGAASRTADGLVRRLRGARNGKRPAQLIQLLAQRLYLLDKALEGLDARRAADAVLALRGGADTAIAEFLKELSEMYIAWARRRGMR